MSSELLIGIDVGTTALKALLYSSEGRVLAQAGREYPTRHPQPNWAQQDPEDWWQATCSVLPRILAGVEPERVAGIAVSSQTPTMLAVDGLGRPLYPALIWMDRRSEPQAQWLREHVGDEAVARVNGGRCDPYYLAPKLLWFKENQPELYRQTRVVLQANGYIVYRLCDVFSMDASHGPLSLLFNSRSLSWCCDLAQQMGLDCAKLPRLYACAEVVGHVSAEAAAQCGLAAGTPVMAGMTDGTAAAVEAGLLQPGDAVEMTGQSSVLLICSDQPYLGTQLISLGHAVAGRHLVVGAMVASGGALRWFRDELGQVERDAGKRLGIDPFELLTLEAQGSPPGANRLVFLPYLFGERSPIWDTDARGVFVGLSQATTKADLIRAIMEGAAYGLRHNLEAAQASGFPATSLACVGGGARSALWNQIKADVLNRPVRELLVAAGAPVGDAIVAGVGAGVYPSVEAALEGGVRLRVEYRPRPEWVERYDALYRVYLELYPALKATFKRLAGVP
jgi:xylulokinase